MSAAFEFDSDSEVSGSGGRWVKIEVIKVKVVKVKGVKVKGVKVKGNFKGGGQECPPHTVMG